jgi:hypothetical protein
MHVSVPVYVGICSQSCLIRVYTDRNSATVGFRTKR